MIIVISRVYLDVSFGMLGISGTHKHESLYP